MRHAFLQRASTRSEEATSWRPCQWITALASPVTSADAVTDCRAEDLAETVAPSRFANGCPVTRYRLPKLQSGAQPQAGSTSWVINGHDDAQNLLCDPRVGVEQGANGFAHNDSGHDSAVRKQLASVFTVETAQNSRIKRDLYRAMSPDRVQTLRPDIENIVDNQIDAFLAGPRPADLIEAFVAPVTALLMDRLPGRLAGPENDSSDDGLVAGLLRMGIAPLSDMLGLGLHVLIQHPKQLEILRSATNPAIVDNAIDELFRYLSAAQQSLHRVALADIKLGAGTIRKGDTIVINVAVANWEPKTFGDPELLYLYRNNASRSLAFGYGRHRCMGQYLVKIAMQVACIALLRRIPTLRLASGSDQIHYCRGSLAYGVQALPTMW